jgi:hypothetical protein
MSTDSQIFLRVRLLKEFLTHSAKLKNHLLHELIGRASDPTILRRRFRMLHQLSLYESQIIKKIENLQTDDPQDFLRGNYLKNEMHSVMDQSA